MTQHFLRGIAKVAFPGKVDFATLISNATIKKQTESDVLDRMEVEAKAKAETMLEGTRRNSWFR